MRRLVTIQRNCSVVCIFSASRRDESLGRKHVKKRDMHSVGMQPCCSLWWHSYGMQIIEGDLFSTEQHIPTGCKQKIRWIVTNNPIIL